MAFWMDAMCTATDLGSSVPTCSSAGPRASPAASAPAAAGASAVASTYRRRQPAAWPAAPRQRAGCAHPPTHRDGGQQGREHHVVARADDLHVARGARRGGGLGGSRRCACGAAGWLAAAAPGSPAAQQLVQEGQGFGAHREVEKLGIHIANQARSGPAGTKQYEPGPPRAQRDGVAGLGAGREALLPLLLPRAARGPQAEAVLQRPPPHRGPGHRRPDADRSGALDLMRGMRGAAGRCSAIGEARGAAGRGSLRPPAMCALQRRQNSVPEPRLHHPEQEPPPPPPSELLGAALQMSWCRPSWAARAAGASVARQGVRVERVARCAVAGQATYRGASSHESTSSSGSVSSRKAVSIQFSQAQSGLL
jgi:hypothetical protein